MVPLKSQSTRAVRYSLTLSLSLPALTLPLFAFPLSIQLSTLGTLSVVAQKLSKGRDMEIVSSRERITEGIRLYVSISLFGKCCVLSKPLVNDHV